MSYKAIRVGGCPPGKGGGLGHPGQGMNRLPGGTTRTVAILTLGRGEGSPRARPGLALQPHLCPSRPPRLLGLLPEVIWVDGKGEGRSWGARHRRRSASLRQWVPPSPRSLWFCPWAAFQGRLVNSPWASPPPTTPGKRPHQRPSRIGPQSHSRANKPLRRPRRSQLRAEGGCGEGPERAGAGLVSQGQGGEGQAAGVPPPLAVVALSFPWPAENAGSGHSDAWSLKSHIPFSSRSAACLWLGEVRPRGPAGVTPDLEKLLRGAGAAGRGPVHHHSPHRGWHAAVETLQPARGPPPCPDPSSGLQGLVPEPKVPLKGDPSWHQRRCPQG